MLAAAPSTGCFSDRDTWGLPCVEDSACFGGQVCGADGLCVSPDSAPEDTGGADETEAASETGETDTSSEVESDSDGQTETEDGDLESDADHGDAESDTAATESETGDPVCGDGVAEGPEVCDGDDHKGLTCSDFDFGGGVLACDDCQFDLSNCCLGAGQDCGLLLNECCGALSCGPITMQCE